MNSKKDFIIVQFFISTCLLFILSNYSYAIPSFARQTKMSCNTCHIIFPELNAFGRQFKLNGYTLVGMETIQAKADSETTILSLPPISPFSAMMQASYTYKSKEQPGTQNDNFSFPQQLSFFLAGALTPKVGGFIQVTYNDQSGNFGIDNSDLRFADQTELASESFVYGITLNNNPTVQDLWNSVPAWRFPYASSSTSPSPSASTLIEGGLAQKVLGLGLYGYWNDLLYTEISLYKSAQQGSANPPDSTSKGILKSLSPYWRVALQKQFETFYLELGTFGMSVNQFPEGVAGATDKFTDIGFDLNFERPIGDNIITAHVSYINETRNLDASFSSGNAINTSSTLNTLRAVGNIYFHSQIGLSLGYFSINGDSDPILYPSSSVSGSANSSPNSNGIIFEINYLPWLNTKLSAQYVAYNKFDGGSSNYDGFGRNASDNNTAYLLCWVAF